LAAITIFIVALVVRLIHVWQIRKAPLFDVLMGDARGYDEWARRIAAGEWIGRDVFYQAPLYPYFLGAMYAIGGRSLLLVRICQAAIGSLSCVLLGAAARRLFSPAAGLAAGLMLALYAPAIFFDGLIQKSVLDVFFVCLALYLIARITTISAEAAESAKPKGSLRSRRALRLSSWTSLGAAIGALSLTRENALVFVLVLTMWAFARGRMRAAAAFLAGAAIVVAPVAIRNSAIGGGFYITTSQFGPNLYIGNHPGADGSYQSLKYGRGAPEYERQDATELAELAVGHPLTPSDVSSYWTERALDFITGQPAAWLRLVGRKVLLLGNRVEMVDTEDQATYADWSLPLRILGPIGTFGLLVPLALVGAFVTWPDRKRLMVLYALVATYAMSVVMFYVFARYRYPLVPMLMLLAAAGVAGIRPSTSSGRPEPVEGRDSGFGIRQGAVVVVALVFCNWPTVSAAEMRAVTASNLGAALQTDGRLDEAIVQYRQAIADRPDYAPAYSNLASALRAAGRTDEARAMYERALALQPDFAAAHFNLANLLLAEGKTEAAAAHFERAVREEPASADVHNNLGIALASTGKRDEAIQEFRAAIAVDPKSAKAYRNLGDVLSAAGHIDEAIASLKTATAIDPNDAESRYDLASTLLEARQFEAAVEEFRATIRISPRYAEAHNNLGIALGSLGQMNEAIAEFRRALEIQPDLADARQNLAMAQQSKR
jgi:tetratricopeptide (TPR) repeat protein